jgi:hypothetical protein
LIPGIFASLGLTLSLLAGFWCKNFKFTPVAVPVGVDDPDIHMSPWFQQTTTVNSESSFFFRRRAIMRFFLYHLFPLCDAHALLCVFVWTGFLLLLLPAGSINGEYYVWTEKFCVDFWVAPELDAFWKASRAFSIIAATIGA